MDKKYLYIINYQTFEKNLCELELKYIFNEEIESKFYITHKCVDQNRSPFIKSRINIIYIENTLDNIIDKINKDKLSYSDFKVNYIKVDDDNTNYEDRLNIVRNIGYVITGIPDLHNPKVNLAILKLDNKWILGEYIKNNLNWNRFNNMPHSYSNALSLKMARALVNVAINNEFSTKIIDPCCGIGTVVLQAKDLQLSINGYEISKQIAHNARNNLEFYGFERNTILQGDMHNINNKYDVSIIDIPYGLYSPITREEQLEIIKTARRISSKMILISFEDMDSYIISEGFTVNEKVIISKNRFNRYITICD